MGTLHSLEWPPLNTGNGRCWQGWRSKTLFHYVENTKCICSGNHFYIFLTNLLTSYKFSLWPICSSPRLYLKEMNKNVHVKIGTCVSIAIVFIIAQTRKPWTGERPDKQNMTFSQNGISFNSKEEWHKPEAICIVMPNPMWHCEAGGLGVCDDLQLHRAGGQPVSKIWISNKYCNMNTAQKQCEEKARCTKIISWYKDLDIKVQKKQVRRGIGRAVVAWSREVVVKSVGEHQKPLGRIEMV